MLRSGWMEVVFKRGFVRGDQEHGCRWLQSGPAVLKSLVGRIDLASLFTVGRFGMAMA